MGTTETLAEHHEKEVAEGEMGRCKDLAIQLAKFPRVALGHLPTPLEPMDRLSELLGGPRLWVKRDDCTGLSSGGNKTRKLEYLMADRAGERRRHNHYPRRDTVKPCPPDGRCCCKAWYGLSYPARRSDRIA